jgi:hypothetical protein
MTDHSSYRLGRALMIADVADTLNVQHLRPALGALTTEERAAFEKERDHYRSVDGDERSARATELRKAADELPEVWHVPTGGNVAIGPIATGAIADWLLSRADAIERG